MQGTASFLAALLILFAVASPATAADRERLFCLCGTPMKSRKLRRLHAGAPSKVFQTPRGRPCRRPYRRPGLAPTPALPLQTTWNGMRTLHPTP